MMVLVTFNPSKDSGDLAVFIVFTGFILFCFLILVVIAYMIHKFLRGYDIRMTEKYQKQRKEKLF